MMKPPSLNHLIVLLAQCLTSLKSVSSKSSFTVSVSVNPSIELRWDNHVFTVKHRDTDEKMPWYSHVTVTFARVTVFYGNVLQKCFTLVTVMLKSYYRFIDYSVCHATKTCRILHLPITSVKQWWNNLKKRLISRETPKNQNKMFYRSGGITFFYIFFTFQQCFRRFSSFWRTLDVRCAGVWFIYKMKSLLYYLSGRYLDWS